MVHLAAAGEVCPQTPVTTPQRKPAWELADIFRLHGEEYRQNHPLPRQHLKVMNLIEICRTAALGGHIERCDSCGYELQAYNSCRNRHCPKCQTLAKEFRNCYSRRLKGAYENGKLIFPGKTASLGTAKGFSQLLGQVENKNWIVYAKRPFAGPEQVLEYLGRYTHRVAISNHRIKSIEDVTFSYKDRADNGRTKLMTLEADEFIRRFLLHILPEGYMKIRHFGFLANTCKKRNLECIHEQLGVPFEDSELQKETVQEMMLKLTGEDISLCPRCGKGHLIGAPNHLAHSSLHLLARKRFDSS